MKCTNSFVLYLLVGAINTIVGFGIIFILMAMGVNIELSNLLGYACGLVCSYLLNKTFTFKSKNTHAKDLTRFLIAMGIAYSINLAILSLSYRFFGINAYVAQVLAGIFYVIGGYCLNRFWAFKSL
ncbi:GtrA family protein [Helicobacter sp. 11S02596-1]|uniref:GtrA family protein n=1 Tax=Helicobacter sp. 11S02596-1 TaxID=1476194 RepID=UPI000BC866DC|nr:GtrA family protein [Helicobacter sp. 11S02596-1]PAF43946.1 hypothetical protein BJI48_03930 [Helicobacter sp. 11S02596-1]